MMILILLMLSAITAAGLIKRRNMWPFIVAYWLVLTIKNFLDLVEVFSW